MATGWVDKLRIRTPGIQALCLNLSGGNQQKVVLAKWLAARSRILILDHPTRGLDVGAKEEVYELIRELSGAGIGIILTADTLEETIGLSHTDPCDARRRGHARASTPARAASPSRSS